MRKEHYSKCLETPLFLSLPTIITHVPALIILHFTLEITCCLVSSPSPFCLSNSLLHSPLKKNFPESCSDYVSLLCSDLQCHCTPNPPKKSEHMNLTSTIHMALPQSNCNNSYNSLHTLNCCPNVSINCFLNIPWRFSFSLYSCTSLPCFYF